MTSPYDVMAPFHACSAERDAALTELRREDPVHWDPANQLSGQLLLYGREPDGVVRLSSLYLSKPSSNCRVILSK